MRPASTGEASDGGEPYGGDGGMPTFLIIGAPKCGTTSLHRYLALHPEIFMSDRKELKLFSRPDWRDHLGWYRQQFSAGFSVRGESSPAYSLHPLIPGVPKRISSTIPGAKLVYLVRDPIDRFISHYVEERALGFERRSLEDVIADLDAPDNRGVIAGRYAFQLDQFRPYFPREQILIVDQWDLMNRRSEVLREVFEFLQVDSEFWTVEFEAVHNERDSKVALNRAGSWLRDRDLLATARTRIQKLPVPVRKKVERLITVKVETPLLAPRHRQALEEKFSSDVVQLRRETGRPFASWSI